VAVFSILQNARQRLFSIKTPSRINVSLVGQTASIMVDTASIVVAVISLAATIGVGILGGFLTIYGDDRKAQREQERLLRRYRDPLLLAAQDLQSRIFNITNQSLIEAYFGDANKEDALIIYTAYLFGQYLSWTHILRRQAQFVCFATEDGRSQRLVKILEDIKKVLNSDRHGYPEDPFMLWKGQQLAIGELMTCLATKDDATSELQCMGYSDFTRKWKHASSKDESLAMETREEAMFFRDWFRSIETGMYAIHEGRQRGDGTAENRLRRLQHSLIELINELDPKEYRVNAKESGLVRAAHDCLCSKCSSSHRGGETGESATNV
jgi:hypothetical protein